MGQISGREGGDTEMGKFDHGLFSGEYHLSNSILEVFEGHLVEENPTLRHAQETLIATFPKDPPDGDGQPVEVYCTALPAEFFTIRALEASDGVGSTLKAFEISTGSGMAELTRVIAQAITEGMLSAGTV